MATVIEASVFIVTLDDPRPGQEGKSVKVGFVADDFENVLNHCKRCGLEFNAIERIVSHAGVIAGFVDEYQKTLDEIQQIKRGEAEEEEDHLLRCQYGD